MDTLLPIVYLFIYLFIFFYYYYYYFYLFIYFFFGGGGLFNVKFKLFFIVFLQFQISF